jgi:hypothetical protein
MEQTHEEVKQSYKEIVNLWNTQPFLERLHFLLKLRFNQDLGEKIAKQDFNRINDLYRIIIFNELNKNQS